MYLYSLASAAPSHVYSQQDCWEAICDSTSARQLRPGSLKLLDKILHNDNGIATRHLCLPDLAQAFDRSPQALNQEFEKFAPALSVDALQQALDKAGLKAAELDALFVCTCTGYLCPGISSHVAEMIGCRSDIGLYDIVGLGCGAAIPSMRSADVFLASNPDATVATIAVEVCSTAFFMDDDPGVLISLCLFGDAAVAAIWRAEGDVGSWKTGRWQTLHLPEHREKVRFVNSGGALRNKLHKAVPELSSGAVETLFEQRGFEEAKSPDVISHSGGRNVIDAIESRLSLDGDKLLTDTRSVLSDYGNCSSPSVLMALERYLDRVADVGQRQVWLTSFGAGFSAHACDLVQT